MDTRGRVLLEAVVISVGDGPFYYPACKLCYSKLTEAVVDVGKLSCLKCQRNYSISEVNQRYRLSLTISDGKTLANVTAFGNTLTPFFGCSATDFHNNCICRLREEYHWNESSVIKSAIERIMVGHSFLFGFKGIVKKPKGFQIYLKDITDLLKHSPISHFPGWRSDLIALQIIPQNDSHLPSPVIHHLPKLKGLVENHEDFVLMNLDDEVAPQSSYKSLANNSILSNDNCLPTKEERNDSHMTCCGESDLRNSVFSVSNETSLGFSFSGSTQQSCASTRVCNKSTCGPSKWQNALPEMKKASVLDLANPSNIMTPLSSKNTSWSVKRWLKQQKDFNFMTNNLSSMTLQIPNKSEDNVFPSPELGRDEENSCFTSRSISKDSAINIILSPKKHGSNQVSTGEFCMALKFEDNTVQSVDEQSSCFVTNRRKKKARQLTLKTSDSCPKDYGESSISTSAACQYGNVNTCMLSSTYLSADENCDDRLNFFSPSTRIPNENGCTTVTRLDPRLYPKPYVSERGGNKFGRIIRSSRCLSEIDNYGDDIGCRNSKEMSETKVLSHCCFIDMPDSEDFDLFVACANVEKLELESSHYFESSAENKENTQAGLSLHQATLPDSIPQLETSMRISPFTKEEDKMEKEILESQKFDESNKGYQSLFSAMQTPGDCNLSPAIGNLDFSELITKDSVDSSTVTTKQPNTFDVKSKDAQALTVIESVKDGLNCDEVTQLEKRNDVNLENLHSTLLDMPESEDFDHFLLEANQNTVIREKPKQERNRKIAGLESFEFQRHFSFATVFESIDAKTHDEMKDDINCDERKDEVVIQKRDSSQTVAFHDTYNGENTEFKGQIKDCKGLKISLPGMKYRDDNRNPIELCHDNGIPQPVVSDNNTLMIMPNTNSLDTSGDLFNSPTLTSCFNHESLFRDKSCCGKNTFESCQPKANNLHCLGSCDSPSHPSISAIEKTDCEVPNQCATKPCRHFLAGGNQKSYLSVDEGDCSLDLFSQDFSTPPRQSYSIHSTVSTVLDDYYSPDLFSSQKVGY